MNKKDVKNAIDLEEYYNKVRKIKFRDDVEITSIEDIYNNLFGYKGGSNFNQKDTVYKNGAIHCSVKWYGRNRSFDDFFNLCKSYFPKITLKEISLFLIDKEKTLAENGKKLCINYCSVIRKYNLWDATSYSNPDIKHMEELPINQEFVNSQLTLKDLIT